MAYIDEEATTESLVFESTTALFDYVKKTIWQLYETHKYESHKGKLWGIVPYSIKVEKVQPILEKFLGKNPYES